MKRKIVPFVDHEIGFRLLDKLFEHVVLGEIEIPLVVTSEKNGEVWWPGVEPLCEEHNIPLFRYGAGNLKDHIPENVDWFMLLSWTYIMPLSLIEMAAKGVVNLHYSLLPMYRGVYPVNWAVVEGERKTGITYHVVTQHIDSGPILLQAEARVYPSDTARTLQLRLDELATCNFDAVIAKLLSASSYEINRIKENSHIAENTAYYSHKKFKESCEIDLNASYTGAEIINLLRGLTFLEDTYNAFFYDPETGKKVFLSLHLRCE